MKYLIQRGANEPEVIEDGCRDIQTSFDIPIIDFIEWNLWLKIKHHKFYSEEQYIDLSIGRHVRRLMRSK